MSLIMPNGSRTVPLPTGPATPYQPSPQPRPAVAPESHILEYLYQQLKMEYPGIPDIDLREAAKKMYSELRSKQASEFNQRFFPERVTPPPSAPPAVGQVSQNEQRPWKYSPGKPGNMEFTDTPAHAQQQRDAVLRRVSEEQANAAKVQAQNQANFRKSLPGQAQPIQQPSYGTPYRPNDAADPSNPGVPYQTDAPATPDGQIPPMTDAQIFQKNAELKAAGGGMGMQRVYRDRDGIVKVAY